MSSEKDLAKEILDLGLKCETLNGDEYWKTLYRLKKLAIELSELIAPKE